ncbi:MAG: hypothetical protein JO121_21280 [Deltaproteobacteria bacterium]|nr:hypothetical protein [Deltaproteobacteria bacterium]
MLAGRSSTRLIFAALAIAYLGCYAPGAPFKRVQPTSNHAVIYVYRQSDPLSATLEPDITCGHATIAIVSGGYYPFVEQPGTVACYASSDASSRIEFETRPEGEYFVNEVVAAGVREGAVSLKPVSSSRGLSEIESCNYTVK